MINKQYLIKIIGIGLCIMLCISLPQQTFSQVDSTFKRIEMKYADYLRRVVNNNLEYASEKYNIDIAEAGIKAAKIFQDPTFAFDWAGNEEGRSIDSYELTSGLSKTFEIGGKRKARINLAKSEHLMVNAMLDNYLRNLRADATLDYLSALKQNYLYEVTLNSFQSMKELSEADNIRLKLGSITEIDAAQSKIEAGILQNELFQVESERKNLLLNLSNQVSVYLKDTVLFPMGDLNQFYRLYLLDELLTKALNSRADLMIAKSNKAYNEDFLTLTKRERIVDLDVSLGISKTYLKGVGTPDATELTAGIAVPLKFSNLNRSDIKMAQIQLEQGELQYQQVEIKIQNEVTQAFNQYISTCKQVENYNQGLLEQAKMVLKGKMYSYSRGETSLLEVLNAQRTYNDLQISYYETLYKCNVGLVELERAVGIWDIDL